MTDPPHAASHPSLAGINDGSTQSRKTGNMSGVLSDGERRELLGFRILGGGQESYESRDASLVHQSFVHFGVR